MITKDIKSRLAEYFFTNPTSKLRVRQIEKTLNLPLPSVIRYSRELEKECILKTSIISNVRFYSADKSSKEFIFEKKMFNIKQIYESGLLEYLINEYSNPIITLFGSYSKGEDVEDSDIDIYIQTPSDENKKLDEFEKKLKRKIQVFKHKSLSSIKNEELANNIINGMILNGFLEVF